MPFIYGTMWAKEIKDVDRKNVEEDWRKKRRKPPAAKRSKNVIVRVTEDELEDMHSRAWDAGLTLADYVRQRCLSKKGR